MRYLLILLACFVSPAYASAVICPDGITYTDSAANKCPAYRAGLGVVSIEATTANVAGTVDAQGAGATWYHWTSVSAFPPGCSAANYTYADLSSGVTATRQAAEKARQKCMNWRTMVAGTGATSYGSVAAATEGSFSHQVSGLTAETTYYTQEFHMGGLGGAGKVSLMSTRPFTTIASVTPVEALSGLQRFIKDDGNDNNDGLTDATAKLTLAAGCPSSLQAGTDCNLKTGDTWSERMTISHAGTADNYSVIRCYKMDGGNPFACESGDTKPILLGAMDQTKLTAGTEDYRASKYTSEGTSYYTSQYLITSGADYTEHKYIAIKNSRGLGISLQGDTGQASGPTGNGDLHHVKLTGMTTLNTANSPIGASHSVSDVVIRDGNYGFYNTCEMQQRMTGVNYDICADAGWPGGIYIVRGVSRILVENNDVHNGFGEGMNCYNNGGAFSIFRGNRIVNVLSGGMYSDICTDNVVENNIFVGNRGAATGIGYTTGSGNEWGSGLSIGWEDFNLPTATNTLRILYRNNLLVGNGGCSEGSVEPAAAAAGRTGEYKLFGNTCVDPVNNAVSAEYATGTNNHTIHVQNNVAWSDLSAAAICKIPATPVVETFVDNHWSTAPSDAECVGSGDTSGVPGLTVSTYATWEAYAYGSMPTFANAAPTAGAIKDTCTALTSSLLTTASYGFAADNIAAVLAGTITLANWGLQNALDANDVVRGATCSKGAVE